MADVARVDVTFLADGRCLVRSSGAQAAQAPSGGGYRCPLPGGGLERGAIELRVALPTGVDPADTFPQLAWQRVDGQWIGTAALVAPPAFVHVSRPSTPPAPSSAAAFGWNFYGFFLFSAVFIGSYFLWSAWMARRDAAARR